MMKIIEVEETHYTGPTQLYAFTDTSARDLAATVVADLLSRLGKSELRVEKGNDDRFWPFGHIFYVCHRLDSPKGEGI